MWMKLDRDFPKFKPEDTYLNSQFFFFNVILGKEWIIIFISIENITIIQLLSYKKTTKEYSMKNWRKED